MLTFSPLNSLRLLSLSHHMVQRALKLWQLPLDLLSSTFAALLHLLLTQALTPHRRVPVLLSLAYLLLWYRRRTNWDIDTPTAVDEDKPITADTDVEKGATEQRNEEEVEKAVV